MVSFLKEHPNCTYIGYSATPALVDEKKEVLAAAAKDASPEEKKVYDRIILSVNTEINAAFDAALENPKSGLAQGIKAVLPPQSSSKAEGSAGAEKNASRKRGRARVSGRAIPGREAKYDSSSVSIAADSIAADSAKKNKRDDGVNAGAGTPAGGAGTPAGGAGPAAGGAGSAAGGAGAAAGTASVTWYQAAQAALAKLKCRGRVNPAPDDGAEPKK